MKKKSISKMASELGRLAKGIAKTLSDEERDRRATWARGLAKIRRSNKQEKGEKQ